MINDVEHLFMCHLYIFFREKSYWVICHYLHMNHELPDVQAGFRKGRGTRDQHPLDHRKSKRVPEKTSISALLTMPKPLTVWIKRNWKILKEMGIPDHFMCFLLETCMQVKKQQLESDMDQQTGSK